MCYPLYNMYNVQQNLTTYIMSKLRCLQILLFNSMNNKTCKIPHTKYWQVDHYKKLLFTQFHNELNVKNKIYLEFGHFLDILIWHFNTMRSSSRHVPGNDIWCKLPIAFVYSEIIIIIIIFIGLQHETCVLPKYM